MDKAGEVPVGVVVGDVFLRGGLEVDVLPAVKPSDGLLRVQLLPFS